MGSITGERRSSHASATCDGAAPRRFAASASGPPGSASLPTASGNQGMKPIPSRSQWSSTPLPLAVGHVVAVLHRGDGDDAARGLDLLHRHLAQARRGASCPRAIRSDISAVLVLRRHLGSTRCSCHRSMVSTRSRRRLASQVARRCFGWPLVDPLVGPGALEAALGGDHQPGGIRMQRLRDELLAHVGAVRIRRVDQVDAQLHRAPQHADGLLAVRGRPPDALARDAHRPEAQAVHLQLSADAKRAARRHRILVPLRHPIPRSRFRSHRVPATTALPAQWHPQHRVERAIDATDHGSGDAAIELRRRRPPHPGPLPAARERGRSIAFSASDAAHDQRLPCRPFRHKQRGGRENSLPLRQPPRASGSRGPRHLSPMQLWGEAGRGARVGRSSIPFVAPGSRPRASPLPHAVYGGEAGRGGRPRTQPDPIRRA